MVWTPQDVLLKYLHVSMTSFDVLVMTHTIVELTDGVVGDTHDC